MAHICGILHNCISIYKKPCPDLREKILLLLNEGIPLIRAFEIYLIAPEDFAAMKVLAEEGDKDLLEFAHQCMLAEATFEINLVRTAIKNPNAAAKLLENRFSQTWKNYTESDLEKMSPKQLEEFINAAEKKQLLIDVTKGSE
jgi:hypothetical protein